MFVVLLGFITALAITYLAIPRIIRISRERHLYDTPNERSAHAEPTPALGGVAIFAGTICAIVLWTPMAVFGVLQYILAAFVLVFFIGVTDDLQPMSPTRKFTAQLLVATILAYKAHVQVNSLYGLFGITELPELTGFALSVIGIVGIINAFNLIDGIDGLAGGIGLVASLFWGVWFYMAGAPAMAIIAFSLAGALVAFLKFNVSPAKIFMGDTGSLLIGMVCAILAVEFIKLNTLLPATSMVRMDAAPAMAVGVLILPLYDTLRVFFWRLWQGRSPFHPDKNHIHHLLLDLGYSHTKSTVILIFFTLFIIALGLATQGLSILQLLAVELGCAVLFVKILQQWKKVRG